MNLSIIIPLFNEENSVLDILRKIINIEFPLFVESYEILVIDDHSLDNSFQVVNEYAQSYKSIKVIKHDVNMGKGAAVRTGITHSSGDVYLIQDADSELSPDDIPAMLIAMHQLGVEFVNGSRYLPGICRPLYSYKRYLGNKFFTFLVSVLINVRLTDMACGYKLIHKNLYQKLTLNENRFGFEAELLMKALRMKKNNITEVPVQYFPRNKGEGKKLKNFDGLRIFFTIMKYGLLKMK
jgi:glycosyltransferase involved in cell wall biosynthesis